MKWAPLDYALFFAPIVSGYLMGFVCPMHKGAGGKIPARPPAWVFGVVWPILYLFLGYAWVLLRKHTLANVLFVLILLGLNKWLLVYGCWRKPKWALWTLVAMNGLAILTLVYAMSKNTTAGILLAPFVAWLLFATMLNYTIVNKGYRV